MNRQTQNWPQEIRSDGWPENKGEKVREEEERRRDDGELSFHFPSVWLLDDEGHYSVKEFASAHCLLYIFLFLCLTVFPPVSATFPLLRCICV